MLLLAGVLLLVSFTSADIFVGQIDSFYHLGDELNVSVNLAPLVNVNDFLSVKLICVGIKREIIPNNFTVSNVTNSNSSDGNYSVIESLETAEIEIYKNVFNIKAGEEKEVFISAKLDRFLVGDLRGDCEIRAVYGGEESSSKQFEINRDLEVNAEVTKVIFNPGDRVEVFGDAYRMNSVPVQGFVDVIVSQPNITVSGTIKDGKFNLNFSVPANLKSGKYDVSVRAYEKDNNGEVINEGFSSFGFEVGQLLKKLKLEFSYLTVKPSDGLVYKAILHDQAADEISNDVTIKLYNPNGVQYFERLVKSGREETLATSYNFTPGYWDMKAKVGDIETNKLFFIEEIEIASFELRNETLIITNIGNVPYKKPVEIIIGGVGEVKELDLGLGESKKFKLSAPDGDYNIEVNDGLSSENFGSTFLTGSAIRISDVGFINSLKEKFYILVWLFVIVILLIIGIFVFRRIRKVRSQRRLGLVRNIKPSTGNKSFFGKEAGSKDEGEKSLSGGENINNGIKQECNIVSLKIRNLDEIASGAMREIQEALLSVKQMGANIYVSGEYRIAIFCPLIIGVENNEVKAISAGKKIYDILSRYNFRAGKKIDFGIGVSLGDMIVEKVGGKFKFNSAGDGVISAKRMSSKSLNNVLISKALRGRVLGSVKCIKSEGEDYWIVSEVKDRSKYRDFVKGIKK